jgi:hypothetical protein
VTVGEAGAMGTMRSTVKGVRPLQQILTAAAPSTALRAVPLRGFAGEDKRAAAP